MCGMTITYWHNGNKIREHFVNAVKQATLYDGEFQVLLDAQERVLIGQPACCVVGIEHTCNCRASRWSAELG